MTTDGRDTRWAEHRIVRRRELVSQALRAIRLHGPGVGMDEIAAQAGTSKPVIYRHFGDRAGLYAAVVESVHEYIHAGLTTTLETSDVTDLATLTADLADTYLSLVDRDPHIYRFVLTPPTRGEHVDPSGALPSVMGQHVAEVIATRLAEAGLDEGYARTWGHGIIGFIRSAADEWMAAEPREPRAVVVARISALFTPAFTGALEE